MRKMRLGRSSMEVPVLAAGCMRMADKSVGEAAAFIDTALANGMNFFDHADIYGGGRSEEVFREALKEAGVKREDVLLQSKCGIRKGYFDFSREHINESVEGSLRRLGTDHLDVLLLHRPDTLWEPDEVADTFMRLKEQGKVLHFGVSNQNPMQMRLLSKYLGGEPIVADQLQLSVTNCTMFRYGFNVNMENESAVDRDGGVLEYCRYEDITIQAWSPFQHGFFEGVYVDDPAFPEINAELQRLADKYGVSKNAVVIAWILRHPAKIQPLTGTMDPARMAECAKGADITLTREEWYAVYRSAGNILP